MSQKNRIFIVAGQSWNAGQGGNITDLPVAYKSTYLHNNRVWDGTNFLPMYSTDNNNQFPAFSAGQNNGAAMEFFFKDIADEKGNDIYILKYARGSTGLAMSAGYDWNYNAIQTDFAKWLIAEIGNVEAWMTARDKDFEWSGILWMQGSNDCVLEADSLAYQNNLQN